MQIRHAFQNHKILPHGAYQNKIIGPLWHVAYVSFFFYINVKFLLFSDRVSTKRYQSYFFFQYIVRQLSFCYILRRESIVLPILCSFPSLFNWLRFKLDSLDFHFRAIPFPCNFFRTFSAVYVPHTFYLLQFPYFRLIAISISCLDSL